MAATIYPDYPPRGTDEQCDFLLSNTKDWSILNGLAVRPSPAFVPTEVDPSGSIAVTAPVTLFPSLFSRSRFNEARAIQSGYNELYAAIARDRIWLKAIVEEYDPMLSLHLELSPPPVGCWCSRPHQWCFYLLHTYILMQCDHTFLLL